MTTIWFKWQEGSLSSQATWTSSTRPTAGLSSGYNGYNTDTQSIEVYNEDTEKWKILSGYWTTATRPVTTSLEAGSMGFNSDTGFGVEMWDGTNWTLM